MSYRNSTHRQAVLSVVALLALFSLNVNAQETAKKAKTKSTEKNAQKSTTNKDTVKKTDSKKADGKATKEKVGDDKKDAKEDEEQIQISDTDMIFDDIEIAKRNNDSQSLFENYDLLMKEHLFDEGEEGQKAPVIRLFQSLENESDSYREKWKQHYSVEIDRFLRGDKIDPSIVVKSLYSDDQVKVSKRLLSLFMEEGRIVELAQTMTLAEKIDVQIDQKEWKTKFKSLVSSISQPAIRQWILAGEFSKYLSGNEKEFLKKNLFRGQQFVTLMDSVHGVRPSPHCAWSQPYSLEKVLSTKQKINVNSHRGLGYNAMIFPRMTPILPQQSHDFVMHIVKDAGGEKRLMAIHQDTGCLVWVKPLNIKEGMNLVSYDNVEGDFHQLDVLGYYKPGTYSPRTNNVQPDYDTSMMLHDRQGRLVWETDVKKLLGEDDKSFLAGRPLIVHDKVYIPMMARLSGTGGWSSKMQMMTFILCVDLKSGKILWNKDLREKKKKKESGRNHYYVSIEKPRVQLSASSGMLWVSMGKGEIVGLELQQGRQMLKEKFTLSITNRSNDYNERMRQLRLQQQGITKDQMHDPYDQEFFYAAGHHILLRERGRSEVHWIQGHTGRKLQTFKVNGFMFVRQLKEGLLFMQKDKFVVVSNLDKSQLKFKYVGVETVPQLKWIVPWGSGCLVSNGQNIYQYEFDMKKTFVAPITMMTLPEKYKSTKARSVMFTVMKNGLFAFNDTFVDRIHLWPDNFKDLKKIWLVEQNDYDLLHALLSRAVRDKDWKGFTSLLEQSKKAVVANKEFMTRVVGFGVNFQFTNQNDKAQWVYEYIVRADESQGDVAKFLAACLKGLDPKNPSISFQVNPYYKVGALSLKYSIWNLKGFQGKVPAHFMNLNDVKSVRERLTDLTPKIKRSKTVSDREGLREKIGDDIAIKEMGKKYYRFSTKTSHDLPAQVVTTAWNTIFYYDKNELVSAAYDRAMNKWETQWKFHTGLNGKKTEPEKKAAANAAKRVSGVRHSQSRPLDDVVSSTPRYFIHGPFMLIVRGMTVICLDVTTGDFIWERRFSRQLFDSSFRVEGTKFYFASSVVPEASSVITHSPNARVTFSASSNRNNSVKGSFKEAIEGRAELLTKMDLLSGAIVWKQTIDAPLVKTYTRKMGHDGRQEPQIQMKMTTHGIIFFKKDEWVIVDRESAKKRLVKAGMPMMSDFKFVQGGKYYVFEKGNGVPALTTAFKKDKVGVEHAGRQLRLMELNENDNAPKVYGVMGNELLVLTMENDEISIRGYDVNTAMMTRRKVSSKLSGVTSKYFTLGEAQVVGTDIYFTVFDYTATSGRRSRHSQGVSKPYTLFRYQTVEKKFVKLQEKVKSITNGQHFLSATLSTGWRAIYVYTSPLPSLTKSVKKPRDESQSSEGEKTVKERAKIPSEKDLEEIEKKAIEEALRSIEEKK